MASTPMGAPTDVIKVFLANTATDKVEAASRDAEKGQFNPDLQTA